MWILKAKSTPKTLCHVPQTITDKFLQCGWMHYPAERGRGCIWCVPGPMKRCTWCSNVLVCGTCQSNIQMNQSFQTEDYPELHTAFTDLF